ncbi:MAG: hypothetical protein ABL934_04665 [Lysobacteraceae bacterium]
MLFRLATLAVTLGWVPMMLKLLLLEQSYQQITAGVPEVQAARYQ